MEMRFCMLICLCLSVGCGMPRDPDGTLLRVRGGTLRVGITENEPWTSLADRPHGTEVELIEAFARQWDGKVVWSRDSESDLMESLGRGELDVVIGGLQSSTPWVSHASLTQPYVEHEGRKLVMAVRQGENRLLLELDKFLQRQRLKGATTP